MRLVRPSGPRWGWNAEAKPLRDLVISVPVLVFYGDSFSESSITCARCHIFGRLIPGKLAAMTDMCIPTDKPYLAAGLLHRFHAIHDERNIRVRNCRLAFLFFTVALRIASAQVPDMPQPRVPMADTILLGTIAAGRAGDAFTTHQFLVAGQDEAALPVWIACSQPNMWTYSAAVSTGQIQLTRLLIRRKHPRIARGIEVLHATFIWTTVAHNKEIIPGPHERQLAHTRPNPCLSSGGQAF